METIRECRRCDAKIETGELARLQYCRMMIAWLPVDVQGFIPGKVMGWSLSEVSRDSTKPTKMIA